MPDAIDSSWSTDPSWSTARPEYYQYARLAEEHISKRRADFAPFDGKPLFPMQLEVHVPNETGTPCDLHCKHCSGNRMDQPLASFDDTLLLLIANLKGKIPLFIFAGAYVEPTLNPRLIDFIDAAKATKCSFGLHTHGGHLGRLEQRLGFMSRLCDQAATEDYVSISLDAGSAESYARTKRVSNGYYARVLSGVKHLVECRQNTGSRGPRVRLTYLINRWNCSPDEIAAAVGFARETGVDSLRFSIPYAPFGTSYDRTVNYKKAQEEPLAAQVTPVLLAFVSQDKTEIPYISFLPPEYQDIEDRYRQHCHFGYFQITFGSDGYVYRCPTTASPSFPDHRLGIIPSSAEVLLQIIARNQDPAFDPVTRCKPCGARCNRPAIDINNNFESRWFGG